MMVRELTSLWCDDSESTGLGDGHPDVAEGSPPSTRAASLVELSDTLCEGLLIDEHDGQSDDGGLPGRIADEEPV